MIYLGMKLFNQTVKFLEICQTGVLAGKISYEDYDLLTKVKLGFIDSMLAGNPDKVVIDEKMKERLERIYYYNNMLYDMYRK